MARPPGKAAPPPKIAKHRLLTQVTAAENAITASQSTLSPEFVERLRETAQRAMFRAYSLGSRDERSLQWEELLNTELRNLESQQLDENSAENLLEVLTMIDEGRTPQPVPRD